MTDKQITVDECIEVASKCELTGGCLRPVSCDYAGRCWGGALGEMAVEFGTDFTVANAKERE